MDSDTTRRRVLKLLGFGAATTGATAGSTSAAAQSRLRLENERLFVELNAADFNSPTIVSQAGHRNVADVTGVIQTRPRTASATPEFDELTEAVDGPDGYRIVREYTLGDDRLEIATIIRLDAGNRFFTVSLAYTNLSDRAVTIDHPDGNIHDGVHVVEGAHLRGRNDDDTGYRFAIADEGTFAFSDVSQWTTFSGTNRVTLFDDADAATVGLLRGATTPKMWIQEGGALDYLMNEVTVDPGQSVSYELVVGVHDGGPDAPVVGEEIYNAASGDEEVTPDDTGTVPRPPRDPDIAGELFPVPEPIFRSETPREWVGTVKNVQSVESQPIEDEPVLREERRQEAVEIARNNEQLQSILAEHRFETIGAVLRASARKEDAFGTATIDVVFYDYDQDATIEVRLGFESLEVQELRRAPYQPPPTQNELETATQIALKDERVPADAKQLQATGLLTCPDPKRPAVQGCYHRIIDTRFGRPDEALPAYFAIVDLSAREVLEAGTVSGGKSQRESINPDTADGDTGRRHHG